MEFEEQDFQVSCKDLVEKAQSPSADKDNTAKVVHQWIIRNGGKFFRHQDGQLSLMWDGKIYSVGGRPDTNQEYFALIYGLTGIIHSESKGRQFFEYLQNIAFLESRNLRSYSWGFSELKTPMVYFNPNDAKGRIIKIGAGNWQWAENGSDQEQILLVPSRKLEKFDNRRIDDPGKVLQETFHRLNNCLATDPASQAVIYGWLLPMLLIDLAPPKPILRFEGNHQSGKTTACKLIYQLIYGRPHKGMGTVAANWRDAAANPLVLLDNLEYANVKKEGQVDFLLLVPNGSAREKCQMTSASECDEARPHCLLLCNGIEPFPPDRPELLSRTITIKFSSEFKSQGFIESEKVAEILSIRDDFYSAWIQCTVDVLREIKSGTWKALLQQYELNGDLIGKNRLRPYFALGQIYLRLVDQELERQFILGLANQNVCSEESERGGNPVARTIEAFFVAHEKALEIDNKHTGDPHHRNEEEQIEKKYDLGFTNKDETEPAKKIQIFNALKTFAHDRRMHFPYENFNQFNARLSGTEELLRRAGFVLLDTGKKSHGYPLFVVRRNEQG